MPKYLLLNHDRGGPGGDPPGAWIDAAPAA